MDVITEQTPFIAMKKSVDNKVYDSNNFGKFIIIEDGGYRNMYIQFLYNGYITKVSRQRLKKGMVKNPYLPVYHSKGCMGLPAKTNTYYAKGKNTWVMMLDRCYNVRNVAHHRYGGNGVTVAKRWWVLEYFLEDIPKLSGWELKINDWNGYSLDKDKLQEGLSEGKTYSLDTCCWLSYDIQADYSNRAVMFDAVAPDGTIHKNITRMSKFCKEIGVNKGTASSRLNGTYPYKVGGWDFINKRKKYPNT